MSATWENFAGMVADPRFAGLSALDKAQLRERALAELLGDATAPPERARELRAEFDRRFGAHFRAPLPPVRRRVGGVADDAGSWTAIQDYEEKRDRPVLDVPTETFLRDVGAGKLDPATFDKPRVLALGPLVAAYAPEHAAPWRLRAEELARQEFLPASDHAAPFAATSALALGGLLGPVARGAEWLGAKAGVREDNLPAAVQSLKPLAAENQALLKLAYPEAEDTPRAGALAGLTLGGLGAAKALGGFGVSLTSPAGIAAESAAAGALGAAHAPEAPGVVASLAGKPDSPALNAAEAAAFAGLLGLAGRQVARLESQARYKTALLQEARDLLRFTGTDEELIAHVLQRTAKEPKRVHPVDEPRRAAAALPAPKPVPELPAPAGAVSREQGGQPVKVIVAGEPPAIVNGRWRVVDADQVWTRGDPGRFAPLRTAAADAEAQAVARLARTLEPERLGRSAMSDEGAPIVNADGDVLSGNRRTQAVRAAYAGARGADYRAWLAREAPRLGIPPERVAAVRRPLLVREVDLGGMDEGEFVRRSNPQVDLPAVADLQAGIAAAQPDLAALRGTGFDLEPALQPVLADYARLKASGEGIEDFLKYAPVPRNEDRDFLLRLLAATRTPADVSGLFRRYRTLAKSVFPDVGPRELLRRTAEKQHVLKGPTSSRIRTPFPRLTLRQQLPASLQLPWRVAEAQRSLTEKSTVRGVPNIPANQTPILPPPTYKNTRSATLPNRIFSTYGDHLRQILGPGRISHPEEWQKTLSQIKQMGVELDQRASAMAYSPALGEPGKLILDPNASIAALRHEFQHILDLRALGYPGLRIFRDAEATWRIEYRGYLHEINLARSIRDFNAGRAIMQEMRARRKELLSR